MFMLMGFPTHAWQAFHCLLEPTADPFYSSETYDWSGYQCFETKTRGGICSLIISLCILYPDMHAKGFYLLNNSITLRIFSLSLPWYKQWILVRYMWLRDSPAWNSKLDVIQIANMAEESWQEYFTGWKYTYGIACSETSFLSCT